MIEKHRALEIKEKAKAAAAAAEEAQLKSPSGISTEIPSFDESYRYTHLPHMNDANKLWCAQKDHILYLLKSRAHMILEYGASKQIMTNSSAEDISVFCIKLEATWRNLVGFAQQHPISPGTPDRRLKTYFRELEEEIRCIGTKVAGQKFERWLFHQFEPLQKVKF